MSWSDYCSSIDRKKYSIYVCVTNDNYESYLHRDGEEIAVVYMRAGYSPDDYTSDQVNKQTNKCLQCMEPHLSVHHCS